MGVDVPPAFRIRPPVVVPCPPVARRHDLDVDWRTIALVAGQWQTIAITIQTINPMAD